MYLCWYLEFCINMCKLVRKRELGGGSEALGCMGGVRLLVG